MCDSLQVAKKFGKRHADVIRTIENLIKNDSTQNCVQCFEQVFYKDESGKKNKKYLMNRDGFTFLVMGFTGKKASFKTQKRKKKVKAKRVHRNKYERR